MPIPRTWAPLAASILADSRSRAGLTLTEAARRTGTSRSALRRYESGEMSPSVAVLARIVAAYGQELYIEVLMAGMSRKWAASTRTEYIERQKAQDDIVTKVLPDDASR